MMLTKHDFNFFKFEYFKMDPLEKRAVQQHLHHKISDIREYYDDRDGVITHISVFYEELIEKAEQAEDYEMCQALKDSAALYGILLDIDEQD